MPAMIRESGVSHSTRSFLAILKARAEGRCWDFFSAREGSGGYVAQEKVTATLGGRSGSFVLQHIGTMRGNAPDLNVTVVPDSGTGELTGISGTMTIIIAGGKHSYEFAYSL
jgi:hypothetical protein